MAITKKYKAKGPVTDTLIPLVALDDALGIVIFGIMLSISKALYYQTGDLSIAHILFDPFREIGISLLIGTVIGYFLGMLVKSVDREDEGEERDESYLDLTLAAIFLSVSLADFLHASHILLPMTVGVVFTNQIGKQTFDRESHVVEGILQPILIIFFALAGASLELTSIMKIGFVGIGYIVFRIIGKTLGTYIGAKLVKADANVQNYLGLTLLPQAGVAIGLALAAKSAIPGEVGDTLQTIALATTVVFAVTGPVFVKIGLHMAKELRKT
jgi:NhaP-type Na+/H+ or K+/H+ antiporter